MCKEKFNLNQFSISLPGRQAISFGDYSHCNCCGSQKIGIMAPSGYGKSSLLKAIIGFPLALGVSIENAPKLDGISNCIAYLPQDSRDIVLPWRKVSDQIQSAEMIEQLKLESIKCRYPKDLSGGELRRVAIAHLISLKNKKFYFLDEPFNGLDWDSRQLAIQAVKKVIEKNNALLMFITHYEEEVDEMGAELIRLDKTTQIGGLRKAEGMEW